MKLLLKHDGTFETSVYIKPTDSGAYDNFHSHVPEQYKRSVINSLVERAIKYCSSDEARNAEFARIRQIMANNEYPQSLVDRIIRNKIQRLNARTDINSLESEHIKFYVQLFSLSGFKSDTRRLKSIVLEHVKPANPDSSISLLTYFKPHKISAQFTSRPRADNINRTNVVYQFSCCSGECNSSYIGYTAQTLVNRIEKIQIITGNISKVLKKRTFTILAISQKLSNESIPYCDTQILGKFSNFYAR